MSLCDGICSFISRFRARFIPLPGQRPDTVDQSIGNSSQQTRSKPPIVVGSRKHMCMHEAGHAETALLFGATVTSVHVAAGATNPHASIRHLEDLSTKEPVACGGYAVEWMLFVSGRLVDTATQPISRNAFDKQAMDNARLDKRPFYLKRPMDATGIYPGAQFQPRRDWTWEPASDVPFRDYAKTKIVPLLCLERVEVEAIADALDERGHLTAEDVHAIRAGFGASPAA